MRAGRMVSIAGADASPGAGRKTRAACGSASWSIIEFSNPDTNTKAEHYWHRREVRDRGHMCVAAERVRNEEPRLQEFSLRE